jgi:hypothetical protein
MRLPIAQLAYDFRLELIGESSVLQRLPSNTGGETTYGI